MYVFQWRWRLLNCCIWYIHFDTQNFLIYRIFLGICGLYMPISIVFESTLVHIFLIVFHEE